MFNWNAHALAGQRFPMPQQQMMPFGQAPQMAALPGQMPFQQPNQWMPNQGAAMPMRLMMGQTWPAQPQAMFPMPGNMMGAIHPMGPFHPPMEEKPPLPSEPPPPLPDAEEKPPLPVEPPEQSPKKPPVQQSPDPQVLADVKRIEQEEKMFMEQYKDWKKQYDDWREQNQSHPNKEQYQQYLEQWQTYEKQMEERRESLMSEKECLLKKLPTSSEFDLPPSRLDSSVKHPGSGIRGLVKTEPCNKTQKDEEDSMGEEDMNLDDEDSAAGGIIESREVIETNDDLWKPKDNQPDGGLAGVSKSPGIENQWDLHSSEKPTNVNETTSLQNKSQWKDSEKDDFDKEAMDPAREFDEFQRDNVAHTGMPRGRGVDHGFYHNHGGRGGYTEYTGPEGDRGFKDGFAGGGGGSEVDNECFDSNMGFNEGPRSRFNISRGRGGYEGGRGGYEGGRGGYEGGRGGYEGGRVGFEGGRGGFEGGRGGFEGNRGGFESGRGGYEGGRGGFEGGRGGFDGGRIGFEGGRGGFEGESRGFEGGRGGFEGGRGGFEGGRGGFEGGRVGFEGGRGGFEGGRGGFESGRGGFEGGRGGFEGERGGFEDERGFEGGRGGFKGGRGGFDGGRGGFEGGRGGFEGGRGGFEGGRGGFEGGRGGFEGGRGGFEGGRGGFESGRGGFEGGRGGFEGGRGGFEGGRGGFEGGRGGFEGGRGGFEGGRGGFEGGRGRFEGGRGGFEGRRGGFEGGRGFDGKSDSMDGWDEDYDGGSGYGGGRGASVGGRGGFERARRGFGRGRVSFDRDREGPDGIDRGSGYGDGRGGHGRGRGGFEGGRGGFEGIMGDYEGGFERGRGGRGAFDRGGASLGMQRGRGGYPMGRGGYDGNRELFEEDQSDVASSGFGEGRGRFQRGRPGMNRGRGSFDRGIGNLHGGRGGFDGHRTGQWEDSPEIDAEDPYAGLNYHGTSSNVSGAGLNYQGTSSNVSGARAGHYGQMGKALDGQRFEEQSDFTDRADSLTNRGAPGGLQTRDGGWSGFDGGSDRKGNNSQGPEGFDSNKSSEHGGPDLRNKQESHDPPVNWRNQATDDVGRGRVSKYQDDGFSGTVTQDEHAPPMKRGRFDPDPRLPDDRLYPRLPPDDLRPPLDPYRRLPDPYMRDPYYDLRDPYIPPPLPPYRYDPYDRYDDWGSRFDPRYDRRAPPIPPPDTPYPEFNKAEKVSAAQPTEVIDYGHGQSSKDDTSRAGSKPQDQDERKESDMDLYRRDGARKDSDRDYESFESGRESRFHDHSQMKSGESQGQESWKSSSRVSQFNDRESRDTIYQKTDSDRDRERPKSPSSFYMREREDREKSRYSETFRSQQNRDEVRDTGIDRNSDKALDGTRMEEPRRDERYRDRNHDDYRYENSDRGGSRYRDSPRESSRDGDDQFPPRRRSREKEMDESRRGERSHAQRMERDYDGRQNRGLFETRSERMDGNKGDTKDLDERLLERRSDDRREDRGTYRREESRLSSGVRRNESDDYRPHERYDRERRDETDSKRRDFYDRYRGETESSSRSEGWRSKESERGRDDLDGSKDPVIPRGLERISDRKGGSMRDQHPENYSPNVRSTPPSIAKTSVQSTSFKKNETVKIEDLLCPPGRSTRPPQIVTIIRGLPGSGKTYVSKLLREKEISYGGNAPRMLSLDDYFMVEVDKTEKDPDTGKTVRRRVLEYEYEQDLEDAYRQSLLKSFKKTVDDGFFPFIILDATNERIAHFTEFWSYAKSRGFQVYVGELDADIPTCINRNIHRWTEWDIEKVKSNWERLPSHYIRLDLRWLLQEDSIPEVVMEDTVNDGELKEDKDEGDEEEDEEEEDMPGLEGVIKKSKWELDTSEETLDKLDGIRVSKKHIVEHQSMDDYLQLDQQLDDDYFTRESLPGKKRVRWADLEEKKNQSRRRDLGFIVGQTQRDWERITDDDFAEKALNQTKYFFK